jgi:hypothetical protein
MKATFVDQETHREAMSRFGSQALDGIASVLDEMPSMPKAG